MNPLVIKPMTIKPDTVKTLPKAPPWSSIDDLQKRINNRLIPFQPVLLWPIKRRLRKAYNPAGPSLWHLMVDNQYFDRLLLCSRRYNFRERTSLMAVLSSACSAYIFFNRLFSLSSSRIRLAGLSKDDPGRSRL